MKPGEWNYNWWHMNERVSVYYRTREEPTSDGLGRPYAETLAYMQKMEFKDPDSPAVMWRALLHGPESVVEMNIPRTIYPMQIMERIQHYFEK